MQNMKIKLFKLFKRKHQIRYFAEALQTLDKTNASRIQNLSNHQSLTFNLCYYDRSYIPGHVMIN